MSTIALEQTISFLTRHVQRWDRRLRLLTSLIWGPRAVIGGLAFGVVIALLARTRPWLLPEEIALYTILMTIAFVVAALGVIWLWPRTVSQSARRFDYRFGLKERISTALELAGGRIAAPAALGELQLNDAVGAARHVNVRARLPLRVRWGELVIMLLLVGLFVYLLIAPNPKTDELLAERELQDAIDAQAQEIEDAIAEIESNPELSEAEKQALTDPLEEALDILQQEDISQQEAVAALTEAQQALSELGDGMTSEQEAAYQDAASELAGSEMTSDLAQAMNEPDLARSADELAQLARRIGEQSMSQEDRDALAKRLENAADQLQESNPALAEKLREAAQALREGDTEAAQQALREAAELLKQQQEQLENSDLAQAAQNAGEQVEQSQRDLAQAGQDQLAPPPGSQQQGQEQQQAGQGQSQPDQQSEEMQQGGQPGERPAEGQSQQAGEGEQMQAQQPGEGASEGGEAGASGEEQSAVPGAGGEQPDAQSGTGQTSEGDEAQGGSNAPSQGQGEGGAGADTVTGQQSGNAMDDGGLPANSSPEGDFETYDPENEAFNIGGTSEDTIDVGGEGAVPGDTPMQEGEFGPNPEGESLLDYSGVFGNYNDIVSDALESGRIPLDQRDVIHDYFSSLAR